MIDIIAGRQLKDVKFYIHAACVHAAVIISVMLFTASCAAPRRPLPPQIAGVENGAVYGAGVIIDIRNPEEGTEYSAFVDDARIDLGELYEIPGQHTLRVVASKNKGRLISEARLRFEIDNVPPDAPEITGVENGRTYNSAIRVYALNKDGVAYTASIDDDEYVLGSDFSDEGDHTLKVHAIKMRNGLTSTKVLSFSIDNNTYSPDEISYFEEIAFGSEFGGNAEAVKKWDEDIRIHIAEGAEASDLSALLSIVNDLNRLTGKIKLTVTEDEPNIKIHFIPHSQFAEHTEGRIAGENLGLFFYYEDGESAINRAKVLIASDKADAVERAHLLREELTQSLGLGQDSNKYGDSIFYQGWTKTQHYSRLDERIISMLYDDNIRPGMKKSEAVGYFSSRIADLNSRYQVFPEDQSDKNPSFLLFRNELLRSIRHQDADSILKHVDTDFTVEPLSGKGREVFIRYFMLDDDPEETSLWRLLGDALKQGGVFTNQELSVFEAPNVRQAFPRQLDPDTCRIASGEDISMHESPSDSSPVVKKLKYDVVRLLTAPDTADAGGTVQDNTAQWEYAETFDGAKGYIKMSELRHPSAGVFTFANKDGRWFITSVVSPH